MTSHLRATDPDYLWEVVFDKLGKKKMLTEVKDHPTATQIKALTCEPVVIILDEIEDWFENFWNTDVDRRNRNLNFLSTLSEVASETGGNIVFLGALYGHNKKILGKLSRAKPFLKDLGQSEDKNSVVLFRLFKEIDSPKAGKIIDIFTKQYVAHLDRIRTVLPTIENYRKEMRKCFPIHPQLMEILFQNYGSSNNYQNTRGLLYLLSSVVKDVHKRESLVLTSSINPENDEIYDDLFQLEPSILSKCIEDIKRTKSVNGSLAKGILTTVFLYSLPGPRAGCEEGNIYIGNLKPETNINDIESMLRKLVDYSAWYLWPVNGKYVIRKEERLPVSINFRAEQILKEEGSSAALSKFVELVQREIGGREIYIWPCEDIPESRYVKCIISLQYLSNDEIREKIYHGREWRNTLIYLQPKVPVNLTERNDILIKCQRILVCEGLDKEIPKEKAGQLREIKNREEEDLRNVIKGNYGYWIKASGKEDKIQFRPIEIGLKYPDIIKRIKDTYGSEVIEDEILALLTKLKDEGLKVSDLRTKFLKQLGYPIIVDMVDLNNCLLNLCRDKKIVIELGKSIHTADNLPLDITDNHVIYIGTSYTKPAEQKVKKPEVYKPYTGKNHVAQPVIAPEPVEEIRTISLETNAYTTPFNLQNEVEGRLLEDDIITSIIISITGRSLENAYFLEELNQVVSDGTLNFDTDISIHFREGICKSEILKILNKLPTPIQGNIQIKMNIEREKGEAPRKAWDQYIKKFKK